MSIAFFSTANTEGVASLASLLSAKGWILQAEGSTFDALQNAGIAIAKVAITQANKADLLVLNLTQTPVTKLEHLETARPSLLRKTAAEWKKRAILTSPSQYPEAEALFAEHLSVSDLPVETLQQWAIAALRHLVEYDTAADRDLSESILQEKVLHLNYTQGTALRYGENSHQKALFFRDPKWSESSLANAKQLHGKELSYNNIVDADAALEMVREFSGQPTVVIVKHLNPAGLATGKTLDQAFEAAWSGDPVSAFGSVIACSQKVDLDTAMRLKGRFVEILLAPGFDDDALEYLRSKSKDLRILTVDDVQAPLPAKSYKHVVGGMLEQDRDVESNTEWKCVTKTPFPEEKEALARFTWLVTKHTKSNAIVMGIEYEPGCFKVIGLGPGQPNRIDSNLRLCQPRVHDNIARMERPEGVDLDTLTQQVFSEIVLGSDAFFPFPDNVEAAASAGIRMIVQPGGSIRDDLVIQKCDEFGIAMIFTGMRHFRH